MASEDEQTNQPQAERDAPRLASATPAERDLRSSWVVGLGASAGGLGALEEFFAHMPADSGLTFVVITHQHAGQTSLMAELLGRKTAMPVIQVAEVTPVAPDHVYTVRPGYNLAMLNGVLQPMAAGPKTPPQMPVDYFFRSLALDRRDRAIGIVLSGTGSDGTQGLKEIKGGLGMVMVQDSAEYVGMPHSAIATELVDYVLPVAEMPRQLLAYVKASRPLRAAEAPCDPAPEGLQQIFVLIRDRTGHDFSQYKESTVIRRIERRMTINHIDAVDRYVGYLQSNPGEIDLLFRELFIGVTSFFRDPEAWEALSNQLVPLIADAPDDHLVRVWVPGCSTGEETYSLAILLREAMQAAGRPLGVQIFATDLDSTAIDVARAGAFPVNIAADVSAERLARFFTQEDEVYCVKKEIREMVVFAPQNVIADPPFTKLDLIVCRNLLIYLNAALQKKLLPIFHYALRPKGLLFLGSSESTGTFVEQFAAVDRRWKIFRRIEGASTGCIADFTMHRNAPLSGGPPRSATVDPARVNFDQLVDKALLRTLVPPTLLVHERGDVVYVHGRTGMFLEPAEGAQSNANIFNMARQGLQLTLSAAIRQAAASGEEVIHRGVRVKHNGGHVSVDVRVERLDQPEQLRGLFRVSFEAVQPAPDARAPRDPAATPPGQDVVATLERELQYTKESHQGTIEELETTNEELKSTNEKLQTVNAELQAAEERSQESEARFRTIAEHVEDVFVLHEREGRRAVYVSPAFEVVWGRPRDAALRDEMPWLAWVDPGDRERVEQAYTELLGGDPFDKEYQIVRPDGATRRVRARAFPVEVEGRRGGLDAWVLQDVTDERALEETLRQAQKMEAIGTLASGVAHDFNNVLQVILGCVGLARGDAACGAPAREYLDKAMTAARRGGALTRRLTVFSRKSAVARRPLPIDAMIGECAELVERLVTEQTKLVVAPGAPGKQVVADPMEIEQLLLNLAANARDAMPEGGELAIRTDAIVADAAAATSGASGAINGYVRIVVQDSGVGMDAETRARIFEPFFSTKPVGKGTGLGLATVHSLVQQLGGTIAVRSTAGRGTTFTICLPCQAPALRAPAPPPHEDLRLAGSALLVEDEPLILATVSHYLRELGLEVLEAADGAAAQRLYEELPSPPDLLITDLVMPGVGGAQLALGLRERSPGLPVLFITADPGQLEGALSAVPVLRKPFNKQDLAAALAGLLGPARSAAAQ